MVRRKKAAETAGWAERLREAVASGGRPLDELARAAGVRCDQLWRFVRGEGGFPPPVARRLRRQADGRGGPGGAFSDADDRGR
jgi:hypothetical protein